MTEKQTEQELLMQFIEQDCYVDPKEKIDYPPVALSFGEKVIRYKSGEWHCQKVFSRPYDMDKNIKSEKYHTFGLRSINHKMRIEFIEHYLRSKINTPSLVIIDGVADLCADANSISESSELVQKLMEWSSVFNCHIINVIHQNYGSAKLGTGHLGSFLEKKAETVISLEANTVNKDWVTVKCGRSRGFTFDTFSFEVNDFGIPVIVGDLYDPLK